MIAAHLGLNASKVEAVDSAALKGRAPRPRDMRLDVRRLEAALGRAMPTLEEEVRKL
jgi:dTDP-4-dehydrorhamnose reductase